MWKLFMVTMAALAIAGSSLAYAQQRDGDRAGGARFEHHHHKLSPEDRAAFVDARIAALKAGLELTPDQATNWPMFEQALRDMAQLRAQFRAAREARRKPAADHAVRAYDPTSRQHGQKERRAQAYRRRGHTALSESK